MNPELAAHDRSIVLFGYLVVLFHAPTPLLDIGAK
jgi:hypothetical protein